MPDHKKSRTGSLQKTTIAFGLLLIVGGPLVLFLEKESQAGWAMMVAGLILIVMTRFQDIQEISLASFRAKMFERRVDQIEDLLQKIKRLAKESSRLSLAAIQFTGRWDGFTDNYKAKVLEDTRRLLQELEITQDEISQVESLWHETIEFDYSCWALGMSRVPKDLPHDHSQQWHKLLDGGVEGRPSPKEIRAFYDQAGILTEEREEILKDYEYYIEKRQHRRPDAWLNRDEKEN